MIKSLMIKNFRSHKDTALELDKGINVICGLSSSGKTNIFRALHWLIYFRPTGDRMVSKFIKPEEITFVQAVDELGNQILLTKSGKKSEYQINNEPLSGFGTTVPKEVSEALNISDVNIQEQLSQHFLITSSPGEIARTINDVIKIEKVDKWISSLTTKINSANQKINLLESQAKETKIKIDGLFFIEDLKKAVGIWEETDKEYQAITQQINLLDILIKELVEIEEDYQALENLSSELSPLVTSFIVAVNKIYENEKILSLIKELGNYSGIEIALSDLKELDNLVEKADVLKPKIRKIEKEIDELGFLINAGTDFDKQIARGNENLDGYFLETDFLIKEYSKELTEIKQCPICFTSINENCTKKVMEKLREQYEINMFK